VLLSASALGAACCHCMVEQLDDNLLFRWFVGLGMDDAVWNHAVFSKNRDRLLTSDVAQRFFAEVNRLRLPKLIASPLQQDPQQQCA